MMQFFSMCMVVSSQPLNLHWLHKILICICIILVSLGIIGLDLKWKIEWKTVAVSLQVSFSVHGAMKL
ncbi:hypothetical protein GDO81_004322 [Engystomops pustulosus]|uniref:Uncharacterized protein n=1 Tax=Engystomops pustulosus TaxID=76066 RepID=A0AAV7A0P2_ENGPU|nr:hypothetical protein GDO81_004322 [Engystomops pustulosus]